MNSEKMHKTYMDIALRLAENSYSIRNKVGAVLVKEQNIIGFGWNGTPAKYSNECEDRNGNTFEYVIHAEQNVISKAALLGISTKGSVLYTTLSPCYECAKLIIQSGILHVIYLNEYRITDSINLLNTCGVPTILYNDIVSGE